VNSRLKTIPADLPVCESGRMRRGIEVPLWSGRSRAA
jgi:hypothetical protein